MTGVGGNGPGGKTGRIPVSERPGYRFAILVTAVFVVFGALGLSTFSYPAILPAMQSGLHIDNSLAGLLATANLAGYLIMAVAAGPLASRFGPRPVIALGLVVAAAGMVVTGLAAGFVTATAGRFITGVGSATASVPAHLLPTYWFPAKRRGLVTGALPLGASLGLTLSGPLVPRLVASYGGSGWRLTWFVLAGITVVFAGLAAAVIRSKGPSLLRRAPGGRAAAGTGAGRRAVYLSRRIWHLNAVYFAFGFGYMTYMTFFTKRLIADAGYTPAAAGRLFMVIGLVSLVCGTLWGSVADRLGRRPALMMVFGLQTVSYLLFALWSASPGLTLSAVLFGLTAWATPAIMATLAGDIVGSYSAPVAFGFLTAFQGLGQALGPFVGGSLADALSSFTVTYLVITGVSFLALSGAALFPRRGTGLPGQ